MRLLLAMIVLHFDLTLAPESEAWIDQKTWLLWEKEELWVTLREARKRVEGESDEKR